MKFSLLIISTTDWQGFIFDKCEQKLIRRMDYVNLDMDKAEIFQKMHHREKNRK